MILKLYYIKIMMQIKYLNINFTKIITKIIFKNKKFQITIL